MKKLKPLAGVVLAAFMCAAGCGQNEGLTKVRLNEVVHSVFYAPQYVAMEKGFFADEGLEIETSVGQGADKSMTALISDSADIALLGTEAGIYVHNEGMENPPKVFAQLTQRAGNFLISREQEPNFKWTDLKGKSVIGGRLGGMPELVLEYVLKQNGLEIGKDVEVINNISYTSTSGAFVGDVGDYTVEFEPTATTLENQGNGYVVASLGVESGYVPYTVYMATPEYMQNNSDVVQKFTNAIYRGQRWVEEHTSREIAEAIAPQFQETSVDVLETIIERYKAQDSWKTEPAFEKESLDLIENIMEEGGELDARVPFEEIVTNDFANAAVNNN